MAKAVRRTIERTTMTKTTATKTKVDAIDAKRLLISIKECDGAEIPREMWPVAEWLVARDLITLGAPRGPGCNWRRAELRRTVAETLRTDALKLVEQLALPWVADGTRSDEPGSAREAFELLVKHGYSCPLATRSVPATLRRPDGSEVERS